MGVKSILTIPEYGTCDLPLAGGYRAQDDHFEGSSPLNCLSTQPTVQL